MPDPYDAALRATARERLAHAAAAGLARARARGEGPAVISLGEELVTNARRSAGRAAEELEAAIAEGLAGLRDDT